MSEKRKLKHVIEFRDEHVREFSILSDFFAVIARFEYPFNIPIQAQRLVLRF